MRRRIRKTHQQEDIGRLKLQLEGWNIAVQRAKVRYWHKRLVETVGNNPASASDGTRGSVASAGR
jgi:hypothetical protein